MIQPQIEMENGHYIVNVSTSDHLQMIPFDQDDPDILARRLKNRERQRRYRARKRQEADMKRARMISEPTQLQVDETQVKNAPVKFVTEIYGERNWKKEARAHILKQQQQQQQQQQQTTNSNGLAVSNLQSSEDQSKGALVVENTEVRSAPSVRNWKAEARNKRK